MTRKRRLVGAEPKAVSRVVEETLQNFPETAAESSDMMQTRAAIYHLEAALNELTLRREVIQAHARGLSDRMITTFMSLFPSTVAIFVSLNSFFKTDHKQLWFLVTAYLVSTFSIGWIFIINMKQDSKDNHLVGERRRLVQQSLTVYRLRRDELQDQESAPAPSASRGFFRHR